MFNLLVAILSILGFLVFIIISFFFILSRSLKVINDNFLRSIEELIKTVNLRSQDVIKELKSINITTRRNKPMTVNKNTEERKIIVDTRVKKDIQKKESK